MNQALNISSLNSKRGNQRHRSSFFQVLNDKISARKEAKRIAQSLNEVKDFESGKKQPKSFDDFLNEL